MIAVGEAEPRSSLPGPRLLPALAVGIPVAEAALLLTLGLPGGLTLAAQSTALGPFGVFHDLRWLFVFHDSVAAFVLGAVLLLAGRSLLTAFLAAAAWPPGLPRPRFRSLVARALTATLAASVLLAPWVTLLFGAALLPVSWAFFAAVPAALLTILLIGHAGVDRAWWRRLPSRRGVGWVGLTFLVMSAVALLVSARPGAASLPVVALGGCFNIRAWSGYMTSSTLRAPQRAPAWFPATAAAVAALLAVVVVGAGIGFRAAAGPDDRPVAPPPDRGTPAVLVVAGYGSACCDEGASLRAAGTHLLVQQFSYAGTDPGGRPLPHTGEATDADLAVLARLMAGQVDALYLRTGSPVAIVAESEGTLVAAAYLDRYPAAPVGRLVLLSPMVKPGRVVYPDPGVDGPGVVAGAQLRLMADLVDFLAPFSFDIDGPLGMSVRRQADSLHEGTLTVRPGIRQLAVIPVADAVANPPRIDTPVPVVFVPGFHGGLRGRDDVAATIVRWIDGDPVEGSPVWAALADLIGGSASAWQVPALLRPDAATGGIPPG